MWQSDRHVASNPDVWQPVLRPRAIGRTPSTLLHGNRKLGDSAGEPLLLWARCWPLTSERQWLLATNSFFQRRRLAVLSSRMGDSWHGNDTWLRFLAIVWCRLQQRDSFALTHVGTTCHRILVELARDRPETLWHLCDGSGDGHQHGTTGCHSRTVEHRFAVTWFRGNLHARWLRDMPASAELGNTVRSNSLASAVESGDERLGQLVDDIYVLHVRPGGRIAALVDQILAWPTSVRPRLLIADADSLVRGELTDRWVSAGAWRWRVARSCPSATPRVDPLMPGVPAQVRRLDEDREFFARPVLCHWTRAPRGPWPDQTLHTFVVDTLRVALAESVADPPGVTAADALSRIMQLRRLIATDTLTRSPDRVVCFTAQPLAEFSRLRRYRTHLRRWDFELYGVAIELAALETLGVAPVLYIDDQQWHTLPIEQRPWFQHHSTSPSSRRRTDWRNEREWRCRGDVCLDQLLPQQIRLFVPTRVVALQFAARSPWTIIDLQVPDER